MQIELLRDIEWAELRRREVGADYPIDAQRGAFEEAAAHVIPGLRG